jgi:hypothetical protein
VTSVLAVIAMLTFAFSFGNVWALGLRLGVPSWIAPLIGPAVDLSVAGLLVGVRYLALQGATSTQLREPRVLLVFSGMVCLSLNIAGPISEHAYGRAAFDAVGPLLLLGWAEVGPALLRQIHAIRPQAQPEPGPVVATTSEQVRTEAQDDPPTAKTACRRPRSGPGPGGRRTIRIAPEVLAEARRIDAEHRAAHDRPASAATLRSQLHIGGPESNHLVKIVRNRSPDPTVSQAGRRRMTLVGTRTRRTTSTPHVRTQPSKS